MVYLVLFLVSMASLSTYLAGREWRAWYYLRRDGAITEGNIQYKWKAQLGVAAHYYIIYEFEGDTPDGEPFFYSKHTEISRSQFHQLDEGELLQVWYVPHKPHIFRLTTQPFDRAHWTFSAILTWAITLGFVALMLS